MAGPDFISDSEMAKIQPSKGGADFISDSDMQKLNPSAYSEEPGALETGARQFAQGATGGFLDELSGGVEVAGRAVGLKNLGGSNLFEIEIDPDGPTLDKETLHKAYMQARDAKRSLLKTEEAAHPGLAMTAQFAGGMVSPANKLVKGASFAGAGAKLGALNALGNSDSEDIGGMALDTAIGAGIGGGIGFGAGKAAPHIARGAEKAKGAVRAGVNRAGEKLKETAEMLALKAAGPDLKAVRALEGQGKIRELGRWMLDRGVVRAGGSLDDVAAKSGTLRAEAGSKLDDVYNEAQEKFGEQISGIGFDPKRDKELIMKAAREELGDSVGADAALRKLDDYLESVSARHGDIPNEQALQKYQQEVSEYLPKIRQHIRETVQYKKAVGKAGDDASQPVLDGMADDLQRTQTANREIELQGRPASVAREQAPEYSAQQELVELPQRQMDMFNPARGDDLLPLAQKMKLDQRSKDLIANESKQASIEGLELVPRTTTQAAMPANGGARGQTSMVFAPGSAPARPAKPIEVRNPMSPRRTNDIKGAIDDQINYSRNPLTKEPTTEKAFSAARRAVAAKVDEAIESLGGDELLASLKSVNKEYGSAAQVNRMAKDRLNRSSANRIFGLTDSITGGAALTYGAVTDDWKTAAGVFAAKKAGEKFGVQGAAVLADKISKRLLQSPKAAALAKAQPEVFKEVVTRLSSRLAGESAAGTQLPRAADSEGEATQPKPPPKGETKWANDGLEKLKKHGSVQLTDEQLKDRGIRKLLIEASDYPANSPKLKRIAEQVRNRISGGQN